MKFNDGENFPVTDFASPYGEAYRLAPMVQLSRTPGQWQEPLLSVRGAAQPVWTS